MGEKAFYSPSQDFEAWALPELETLWMPDIDKNLKPFFSVFVVTSTHLG